MHYLLLLDYNIDSELLPGKARTSIYLEIDINSRFSKVLVLQLLLLIH